MNSRQKALRQWLWDDVVPVFEYRRNSSFSTHHNTGRPLLVLCQYSKIANHIQWLILIRVYVVNYNLWCWILLSRWHLSPSTPTSVSLFWLNKCRFILTQGKRNVEPLAEPGADGGSACLYLAESEKMVSFLQMTVLHSIFFIFLPTGRGLLDRLTDAVQQSIVDNTGSEMFLTVIQNLENKHNAVVKAGDVRLTSTVRITLSHSHFFFSPPLHIEIDPLHHCTLSTQLPCQIQQRVYLKNVND